MNEVVYDSNFLVGFIDEDDTWHKIAVEINNEVKKKNLKTILLDCVASEVISVLAKRYEEKNKLDVFKDKVLKKFNETIRTIDLTYVYKDIERYYSEVIGKIGEYSGRLNFNDCLIVIFSQENNISRIISFDSDFDEVKGLVRIKIKNDLGIVIRKGKERLF